jgi:hypothetical protein
MQGTSISNFSKERVKRKGRKKIIFIEIVFLNKSSFKLSFIEIFFFKKTIYKINPYFF